MLRLMLLTFALLTGLVATVAGRKAGQGQQDYFPGATNGSVIPGR